MIDSLLANREFAHPPAQTLRQAGFDPALIGAAQGYGVVTLHRPSNVDQVETLAPLLAVLSETAQRIPLVMALHPRTRGNIERFGLAHLLSFGLAHLLSSPRVVLLPPQGYLEMLGLLAGARLVLSDSGGLQEETTALGVPCLTLRANTERPITVDQGTNTLVGSDPLAIRRQRPAGDSSGCRSDSERRRQERPSSRAVGWPRG